MDLEQKMWALAEQAGSFSLDFDASEMRAPDGMPWTLTFTHDGEERRFGGMGGASVNVLFTQALDFVAGVVDEQGRRLTDA